MSEAEDTLDTSPVDIPAPVDWKDSIPADVRDGLGDVDNVADLAKGYVSAQQMIGGSIRIPGEEAGTEDWSKFYSKFENVPGLTKYDPNDLTSLYEAAGRPKSAEDYEVEGDPSFLEAAHAAGLNRSQVEALLQYDENLLGDVEAEDNSSMEQGLQSLRQEWGLAFEDKVSEGQNAVAYLEQSNPGLVAALESTGAGNNPALIRLFQSLGENLRESDGFGDSTASGSSMTPMEAKAQIAEIQNNEQHPFHQGQQEALDHYLELHRYALGEQ